MKRVIILGATGSVGRNVLDVIAQHRDHYHVTAMVAGRDVKGLSALARKFNPDFVALADEASGAELASSLSGNGIGCGAGRSAFMAGVSRHDAKILPLDSEHNALFQILEGHDRSSITRMILTASGGPFRAWSKEQIDRAGPDVALLHPNWSMGPKITIDSASLMNKGLELIEAHHLFGVAPERLDVLVHPQSIVHGLIAFKDGSLLAGMAAPDMRVPAAHCLAYPDRLATGIAAPDLAELACLNFEKADLLRFPCLRLAMEAMRMDGFMPCVLNAANEVAVETFLRGGYRFELIARLVERVLDKASGWRMDNATIADCLEIDRKARSCAQDVLQQEASFWAQ